MCCNPLCSKLQDSDFLNPSPPPPSPGDPSPPRGTHSTESHPQMHLLSLPPAQVQRDGGGSPKQTQSAEQSPALACKGSSYRDRPPVPQLRETLQIFCPSLCSSPVPVLPAGLSRSLSTCGGHGLPLALFPGIRIHASGCWPDVHRRLPVCGALGPASRLGLPRRTGCGQQGGWSPGGAGWAVRGRRLRPGGGSAEASATGVPLPAPAGRCLR